jgi:hypothetical protein
MSERDVIQKCIDESQVGSSRVLSSKSLINLANETMNNMPIEQAINYLQNNVNKLVTDGDHIVQVNPYLAGKKLSQTQPYIDEFRQKYGPQIPTIKEIVDMMIAKGDSPCKGIAFNSIKYPWFDPETFSVTEKENFIDFKTVGDRNFIIGSGVSLSRVEKSVSNTQTMLRKLRIRMIFLFIILWGLITFIYYRMYRENLFVFGITGFIGMVVVYIQILRPFPVSDEANIYDSLNITLRAITITLGSMAFLISRIRTDNKDIITLLLSGFIVSIIGIIITPRKENINKLHEVNDILRVIIATSVTCLLTAIVIAFL